MEILHIKLMRSVLSGLLLAIAVPCATHTQNIADALKQKHVYVAAKDALYLDNKQIDSWDGVEQIVATYPQVRDLYLNGNRLQSPSETVFRELAKLTSLRGLQLSQNCIQRLPETLAEISSLSVLDVANNQLEVFPIGINKLPAIMHVGLQGNRITRVPTIEELDGPSGLCLGGIPQALAQVALYINNNYGFVNLI